MLNALILIRAERSALQDLGSQLAAIPGVSEVYSVTGRWDFVAIVRVRRHEQLAEIVTLGLVPLAGILSTQTMVAFQQFSRHDLEAMFALGEEA
ncbi:MAG TPA: Lrp/AsnC ligand binding domain-containing protein [Candidatus Nitrosotalea sp.]|nr:Lrp/AsnC ligand binding domain-containing protein [Candidatus Nitrosotalea sp.]